MRKTMQYGVDALTNWMKDKDKGVQAQGTLVSQSPQKSAKCIQEKGNCVKILW
jgi:hypothetical protein